LKSLQSVHARTRTCKNKQDRQYTCIVTLRRVRVTIVEVEKQ